MDPTIDSTGQLKKFNDSKRHRGRRQKDNRRQHTTPISATPSHLNEQLRRELARHCREPNERRQEDLLPEPFDDDTDMSFSQAVQARAQEVDDDPQLAQIYWYGRGSLESDTQALLNCYW